MVALELTLAPAASENLLTAFGREDDFTCLHGAYPVPFDLDLCTRLFRANCGPASFAAVTGMLITDIIRFFPQFPHSPHTNIPQMRAALDGCGITSIGPEAKWPRDGLCLLQMTGPWTRGSWSHSACCHRHWIAVRNDFVYDVNVNAWMPRTEWENIVMSAITAANRRATGWYLLKALELVVQQVSFLEFPSYRGRR